MFCSLQWLSGRLCTNNIVTIKLTWSLHWAPHPGHSGRWWPQLPQNSPSTVYQQNKGIPEYQTYKAKQPTQNTRLKITQANAIIAGNEAILPDETKQSFAKIEIRRGREEGWGDKVWVCLHFNPFTPESDQCQNSPAASQEIWHHTVWRTWLFIAYSDEKWLYYKFSLHHSYNRFLKGWENTLFELRSERVKFLWDNFN